MIQRTGDGPVDRPTTVAGGHGREDQGGGVAGRTAWPRGPLKLHSEGVAFIRAETHGSGSRDRRVCGGLWEVGAWNQRPEPCDGVLMDSEMTERNRRIVERFIIEGVLEGLDVFDELCDPGVINHAAAPQAREGIDALKRVIRFSRAAMPDQRWTDRVLVADEEYVVIRAARESTWSAGLFLASPRRRMSPRQLRWCIVGGCPTGRSSSTGPSDMTWP
jgi:SnoaL-like domain